MEIKKFIKDNFKPILATLLWLGISHAYTQLIDYLCVVNLNFVYITSFIFTHIFMLYVIAKISIKIVEILYEKKEGKK